MRRWLFMLALLACGIQERSDFLIGRQCDPETDICDPGQACLPHQPDLTDYRCRDRESFEPINGQEPPLAYCNVEIQCPEGMVCNADRIRADAGLRPLVCKRPDDVFAPPLEGN